NLSADDQTRDPLHDEPIGAVVLDLAAEHDPRPLALDDEGAPALPPARGNELSLVDTETNCATVGVEEARIDGDHDRGRRADLVDGPTPGGAPGRKQTKLRNVEIDLERMDLERLDVIGVPVDERVVDAGSRPREARRFGDDGARRHAAHAEEQQ